MGKYSVIVLCLVTSMFAGPNKPSLTVSPAMPGVGAEISLIYSPGESAIIPSDASGIICEALVTRGPDAEPLLIETPLQRDGAAWKGAFVLSDPGARYIIFRCVSGEQTDDNDGAPIDALVSGRNKKAVEGAHQSRGVFLMTGSASGWRRKPDITAAGDEFTAEAKLYPKNWMAGLAKLTIRSRSADDEKSRGQLRKDLEQFYGKNTSVEKAAMTIADLYDRIGDSARAAGIRTEQIKLHPAGVIAVARRMAAISKERDRDARASLIESALRDFPGMEQGQKDQLLTSLVLNAIRLKQYDRGDSLAGLIAKPDAGLYNRLAWPLIESGSRMEQALTWAKHGIDLARASDASAKPPAMRMKDWNENSKYTLAALLDTYGFGLVKSGKQAEGENALAEAYTLSGGADDDINTHYLDALNSAGRGAKAFDVGQECIRNGKSSPAVEAAMQKGYMQREGLTGPFDSLATATKEKFGAIVSGAQKEWTSVLRKKLSASRLRTPQHDFTLTGLDDRSVTLSGLKGNVVIVDFWATWCGPCKSSFPYLQKVVDRYKSNPSVTFLAINTWERQGSRPAQIENAKKFMADNHYTFPVLIDEMIDNQYKVVSEYGVEGIPTKFIIGRDGNIAWKSVGFDGAGMEEELTQQIEMLLEDSAAGH